MLNLIKRSNEHAKTFINLFNIDFKATANDIRNLYSDVNIIDVREIKPGCLLLELNQAEAVKIVEIGAKVSICKLAH